MVKKQNSTAFQHYKNSLRYIIFLLPVIMLATSIFILSHQPYLPLPDIEFDYIDKVYHFIAYFAFGVSLQFAIIGCIPKRKLLLKVAIVIAIGMAYGASDEFHQSFIPGRTADIWDWVADSVGILLSLFIINYIQRLVDNIFRSTEKVSF